jgi:hypothetical protein
MHTPLRLREMLMQFAATGFACCLAVLAPLIATAAPAEPDAPPPVGSLRELLDLRSIATLKPWRTLQCSSYDPAGGYYDSGHFLRIEDGRNLVALDTQGPGCIDRMWFTRKHPSEEPYELRVFIDDRPAPAICEDLDKLLSGTQTPFVAPLAGKCGLARTPALYGNVPIGFEKRCKIVLVPTLPDDNRYQWRTDASGVKNRHVYYQLTYRLLPPESKVHAFHTPLNSAESKALDEYRRMCDSPGTSPWKSPTYSSQSREAEAASGSASELFKLNGPGILCGLRLTVKSAGDSLTPRDLESLRIEMRWDDSDTPQVSAPLATFFASSIVMGDVRGLLAGCRNGEFYSYLPMPFAKSASVRVVNEGPREVLLSASCDLREEPLRAGDGRLHTHRYDFPSPEAGQDYVPLDKQGAGHVIAVVMDRPGNMEGDDRWFVDGSDTPSIHGTGTEDFFNFAWGLAANQSFARHGITQSQGNPVCYRFLMPGVVPFQRSIRLTWEHGHDPNRGANTHAGHYSGLVFYYLQP